MTPTKWRTEFTAHGKRSLRGIDVQPARKILDGLADLQRGLDCDDVDHLDISFVRVSSVSPRSEGGKQSQYRLALSDFRVIYRCDAAQKIILVDEVGNRRDAYRKHGGRS